MRSRTAIAAAAGAALAGVLIARAALQGPVVIDITSTALTGATTYWLGLHAASDFLNRDEVYWELTDSGFGPAAPHGP